MQRRELVILRVSVLGLISMISACDKGDAKPDAASKPATEAKDPVTKVADAKASDAKASDAKAPDAKAPDAKAPDAKAPDAKAPVEPVAPEPVPPPTEATPSAGGKPTGPVIDASEDPEMPALDLTYESIGGVHVDMPASEVIAKLGKPTKKSKVTMEPATGDYVQMWHYEGLQVAMSADSRKGAQTVAALQASATCKLPASWGLQIGSTRAEVEKVYAACLVPDLSGPNELLTGSVYAGVTFGFTDGKVTSIFIGGGE